MAELLRLQKYMADIGIASRRKCEEFIEKGMVKVNGERITEMGVKIDPDKDQIEVDGKRLQKENEKLVYYALNKPQGYVSACSETKTEKNLVTHLVPDKPRVFPIGRLDKDTTGLIIMTNDGTMTFELTHPSKEHEKEYFVEVNPPVSDTALEKLRNGVTVLGDKTQPCTITRVTKNKFFIILKEGKNRQIRRMLRTVGSSVINLKRVRIGSFVLNEFEVPIGKFKQLSAEEVQMLKTCL